MEQIILKVKKRETGKQVSKRYRRDGHVPGIFYIKDEQAIPILSDSKSLRPIVYTNATHIVNLQIDGNEPREAVLKDVRFDPVTDSIVHFDLIGLSPDKMMIFEVPITFTGVAVGVKEGGIIQQNIHKIPIKCLSKYLPSSIGINITSLSIGKTIYVHDVVLENVQIDMPGDTVIVSCSHSRVSKSDAETAPKA
jgi:large subunit ribosomal protein L25